MSEPLPSDHVKKPAPVEAPQAIADAPVAPAAAPAFPGPLSEEDRVKLADLARVKATATAMLVVCFALFLAAKALEPVSPVFGFVAAFAEAATIGGLADWYAVVALFKRPLGLPIPHTAIIPANQHRIGDNLGRFIERQFLAPAPVRKKLEEVDFAHLVADWLTDRERSAGLAGFVLKLLPQTLAAIEGSGLKRFVSERIVEQLDRLPVAPLAAEFLTAFTDDRRHQKLLDEVIGALSKILHDEETLAAIREKIRGELPTLFNMFRADSYLLGKIVASATSLLDDVRADPDHALRAEFDTFVHGFIDRLRESPELAERTERLKRDILARPELGELAQEMWNSLATFIAEDARAERSIILTHLETMLVEIGRRLAEEPKLRADMNQGFVVALAAFVEAQKSGVSSFIAGEVKRWDMTQLVRLIEMNIGRDLQYIRFNGMLIGGLAGLVLHTILVIAGLE